MTARPSLDDLDALLAVARTGSIGAAARELGLTQPSLSRRMAALERSLGVAVLHRTTTGSALTEAGHAVTDWAQRLTLAADDFSRAVASLREDGAGDLRVAASMTIAEHYAPGWLGALRLAHPEVEPRLSIGNSASVIGWVSAGDVEVGFIETPSVPKGLRTRRVGEDPLVVAASPTHEWAGRSLSLAEFAAGPLLLREAGSGTRDTLERALASHDLRPVVGMELSSNAALRASALAGLGPVVQSRRSVAGELESGQLVVVQVAGLSLSRPLTAVVRRDAELSAPARLLLEQV